MPVQPTYPGVYIEEIPSGVRTISGVATSIAAFIGRAAMGPVNEPVTINSFGDFERVFGGLWAESTLGYAVRDFYLNGGSQAIIVRLFRPFFADDTERQDALAAAQAVATAASGAQSGGVAGVVAAAQAAAQTSPPQSPVKQAAADFVVKAVVAAAALPGATSATVAQAAQDAIGEAAPVTLAAFSFGTNGLVLEAASPGSWGNHITAVADDDVLDSDPTLFNLSVQLGTSGPKEIFRKVSVAPDHVRRVDKVLAAQSKLVRVRSTLPTANPAASSAQTTSPPTSPLSAPPGPVPAQAISSSSDGNPLDAADFRGSESGKEGIFALEKTDLFNLLCLPPPEPEGDMDTTVIVAAANYCVKRRAMLIVDPPSMWADKDAAKTGVASIGTNSKNAALYFPRLLQPNPLHDNQVEEFVPCGAVAGVFARTDGQRGVWKAPAGLDASLVGVPALSVPLTDGENGELNPLGINCLRVRPAAGPVVWGARTLQGDDRLASEWKYVPVRRLALFLEESLYRGTQWVVFEPNDEPLWAQIRLNIGAFMHTLFRKGAFQGKSPRDAYLVKCDSETTTQDDINRGVVNILVGFAPLKPAEFVILQIQQLAGQIQT